MPNNVFQLALWVACVALLGISAAKYGSRLQIERVQLSSSSEQFNRQRMPPTVSSSGDDLSSAGDWAAQTTSQDIPKCDVPWLDEYERFHQTSRGAAGAKYLLHVVSGTGGGLGDRLRGMLYALRAAAAMKRVVLFSWQTPHALEHFFEPAGKINWSTSSLDLPGAAVRLNGIDKSVDEIEDGRLLSSNAQLITLQTNRHMNAPCAGCPNVTLWGSDAVCLWRRVLKPATDIQVKAERELQALYNTSKPQYVAIHMRLGNLTGEGKLADGVRGGGTPLINFLASVKCARDMARQYGFRLPTLLVVDSHEVREFVLQRVFPYLVTPKLRAVHLDRALGSSVEAHQTTIVDFALLARASCLVTSPSGFSHHAWLAGGGRSCQRMFYDCSSVSGGPGGGPDDWQMSRPQLL